MAQKILTVLLASTLFVLCFQVQAVGETKVLINRFKHSAALIQVYQNPTTGTWDVDAVPVDGPGSTFFRPKPGLKRLVAFAFDTEGGEWGFLQEASHQCKSGSIYTQDISAVNVIQANKTVVVNVENGRLVVTYSPIVPLELQALYNAVDRQLQ
jgi:hypothetical protein